VLGGLPGRLQRLNNARTVRTGAAKARAACRLADNRAHGLERRAVQWLFRCSDRGGPTASWGVRGTGRQVGVHDPQTAHVTCVIGLAAGHRAGTAVSV